VSGTGSCTGGSAGGSDHILAGLISRAAGVDRSNFRRLLKQYEVGGRTMKGGANDLDDEGDFDEAANG